MLILYTSQIYIKVSIDGKASADLYLESKSSETPIFLARFFVLFLTEWAF